MSQSSLAAQKYAKLPDAERCKMAGRLFRERWFAYVYRPDQYDRLLEARKCARPDQIPAWVYKDIEDRSRIPEHLKRESAEDQDQIRTQVFAGGRSSGKTSTAVRWFVSELLERPKYRLMILGPTFDISAGNGVESEGGIKTLIEEFDPTLVKRWDQQKHVLTLKNGSQVFCKASVYPKSVEGFNMHAIWVDEPGDLSFAEGDECIYRMRAEKTIRLPGDNGEPVRKIITGTPKQTELIEYFDKRAREYPHLYAWSRLSAMDNIANVDAEEVKQWYAEGSEDYIAAYLEGHLLTESKHALLTESEIARIRIDPASETHRTPEQIGAFMAVDSSHSADKKSDECGIVIGGKDGRRVHIFADASIQGGSKDWGERIIEGLVAYPEIDTVYVEDDKSMVIEVVEGVLRDALRVIGRPIRIIPVQHGNKSKKMRADPVAVEYQLRHVLHDPSPRTPTWSLGRLERQWKGWNPKDKRAKSPDRVDACVYLVTALVLRDIQPSQLYLPNGPIMSGVRPPI